MKKTKVTKSNPDRSPAGDPLTPALSPKGARVAALDEFKLIPRLELFPDPEQPRKTFDVASMKELADSITEQGIVQPLIVRTAKAGFKILEPDLESSDYRLMKRTADGWQQVDSCDKKNHATLHDTWAGNFGGMGLLDDYADRYVIVAGERRWRASEIAGLTMLPCIVRDVEGHRVFAQQFIENEQRVNISALEEAEALQKQLEARKLADGKFSVEDLAKELGMSRAGLYQRLALMRLHEPVRTALLAGKISTSVAGVVAIVPLPNQQEKLLKEITNEESWKFPYSVRDVQDMVNDDYCRQLKDAPFDAKKEEWFDASAGPVEIRKLPEGVHLGSCTDCPARTGNMLEQFPELKTRPNACTRPDCFAAKCKTHWLEKSKDLAQRGKTVLVEKEFKAVKGDYIDADKQGWGLFSNDYDAPAKVLGKHAPEPVFVSTAEEKYYKRTDIPAAAKAAKVRLSSDSKTQTESAEAKTKREAKELADKAAGERRAAYLTAQIPELMKALAKLKSADAWALAVELVKQYDGYCDDDIEEAAGKAKDDHVRVLGFLFADNDNSPLGYSNDWDKHGVDLWKMAGIDLVKGFEASEKAAQAALPLPTKGEAKQGKLLDVKKNKKKAA